MIFPEQVRTNARRRGPMESVKADSIHQQIEANLIRLKEKMKELENSLLLHQSHIREGKPESTVEPVIPIRMGHLERHIQTVERGVERG